MVIPDPVIFFKIFQILRIKAFHCIALERTLAQRLDQVLFLFFQGATGQTLNGGIQQKQDAEEEQNRNNSGILPA